MTNRSVTPRTLQGFLLFTAVAFSLHSSSARAESAIPFSSTERGAAGFRIEKKDGGVRITALANTPGGTSIPIGEFPAVPGTLYSIRASVMPPPEGVSERPVAFAVRWVDEKGRDAAESELALGMSDPTLRATLGNSKERLPVEITGAAARSSISRGMLEIVVPPVGKGAVFEVREILIAEGEAHSDKRSQTSPDTGDALLLHGDESLSYSENLISNPSFEGGSGDVAEGWHYQGTGQPHLKDGGYAGRRCLLLTKENEGGRWESTISPIAPGLPVWLAYWVRFSKFATPGGHPGPIQFEFLKKTEKGSFVPVPIPNSRVLFEFATGKYSQYFGQWFPVVLGGVAPPEGATHVRVFTQYLDSLKSWYFQPFVAKWGDIELDNVALWQGAKAPATASASWNISPYGAFLQEAQMKLPPFVPVGSNRENSLAFFPVRTPDANLLFNDAMKAPEFKLRIGNLLPCGRSITLSCEVFAWNGETVSKLDRSVELEPYAVEEITLRMDKITRLGGYYTELKATEGGKSSGEGSVRFAWLTRPVRDEATRHSEEYPFDMHPQNIQADNEGLTDAGELEMQCATLKLMGVRGIRLQSRYDGLDFKAPEASAAAAREKVATWRRTVLPIMEKYGIEGWVSFMEQRRGLVPKTKSELEVWRQYNYEQTAAFGKDIQFILFGNEGLGGHTPADLEKNCWMVSAFDGTTRDWLKMYQVAREAAKEASPNIPFGPSQAGDPFAKVIKSFFQGLGDQARFDCWGFNGYGNTAAMGASIFNVMKAHGETSAFGVIPEVGMDTPPSGPTRVAAERKQAIGLVQTYLTTLSKAPWIKRIAWFIIQGGRGHENHPIFDMDWTPRPAAAAYLVMTGQLGAGHVEKEIELPGGVVLILWRKTDGVLVGVAWSSGEGSLTLDVTGKDLAAYDIFGNKTALKSTEGVVTLPLTDVPQYIVGAKTLKQNKLVEVSARNATVTSDKPSTVALRVVNTSKDPQTFAIHAEAHPTVVVQPADSSITLEPNGEATKEFNLCFLKANNRVRVPINFQIANSKGVVFSTKLSDTFAYCARAPKPLRIDGSWKGWEKAQVLHADQRTQVEEPAGVEWKGPADCSAEIRTLWEEKYFYLGVQVRDDVDFADQPIQSMFLNDALEIGFDLEHQLSVGSRLVQLVMGRANKITRLYRHSPEPSGPVDVAPRQMIIRRDDAEGATIYQIAIPWSDLGGFTPTPGKQIGFGVIVDDSDGKPPDRHFISWFGGGISSRRPQDLGDLIFVK